MHTAVRAAAAAASASPAFSAAAGVTEASVAQLLQLPFPPVQPLIGCEQGSFAQDTITQRLPAILDTVLADLKRKVGWLAVCARVFV